MRVPDKAGLLAPLRRLRWSAPTATPIGAARSPAFPPAGTRNAVSAEGRRDNEHAPSGVHARGRCNPSRLVLAIAVLGLVAAGCALPGRTTGPIKVIAVFDDVGDLVVNHAVQSSDVRIGSITKIELTDDFKAKVTMSVKDVGLPRDVVADLRQTSLLGEKFIELRPCDADRGDRHCSDDPGKLEGEVEIPADKVGEAPELEFVAQEAIAVLGSVAIQDGIAPDLKTLVDTGASAFGDRGPELRSIIDDLSSVTATLTSQTTNILTVLDNLDKATQVLADNDDTISQLLVNLSESSGVLASTRDQTVQTLASLTRLLGAQDDLVFDPYMAKVDAQIKELDAIIGVITQGRQEVTTLLEWLEKFVYGVPKVIPGDDAQVFGWVEFCVQTGCPQ